MILAITLAAIAAAAMPSFFSSAPCNLTEFSLAMRYNDEYLALEAIDSVCSGTLYIVGMDPNVYHGTPGKAHSLSHFHHGWSNFLTVGQSGASPKANLHFNIDQGEKCTTTETGKFGIYVPDLGELYGQQVPITATKNQSWPHFFVGGYVQPQMTAASQMWYGTFDPLQALRFKHARTRNRSVQPHCPRRGLHRSQLGRLQLER